MNEPKLAVWPIADLTPHLENPRKINRLRLEDLKRSVRQDPDFLRVRPVIVNVAEGRRGIVIGGHMRLEAARSLGMTEIPVVEVEADENTERKWMLKDNAQSGEWDTERLREIVNAHADTIETAIPSDMMDRILREIGKDGETEEEQIDAIVEAPEQIVQPGDVWEFGEHRLVCGDSCAPATLEKLLGDCECPHCGYGNF